MNKNQKGFSVVEVLVVVIIVGLIGAVGWLVYDRQKEPQDAAQNNQSTAQTPVEQTEASTEKDPYEGWKTYENSAPAFSFKYPGDWKTKAETSNDYKYINIESPDYVLKEASADQFCAQVTSGYKISVMYNAKYSNQNIIADTLKDTSFRVKNAEKAKLGNLDAVKYAASPGECGRADTTATHYKGNDIVVSGSLYKALGEYEETYNMIVKSFEFK